MTNKPDSKTKYQNSNATDKPIVDEESNLLLETVATTKSDAALKDIRAYPY